jgi:hypothetical protein
VIVDIGLRDIDLCDIWDCHIIVEDPIFLLLWNSLLFLTHQHLLITVVCIMKRYLRMNMPVEFLNFCAAVSMFDKPKGHPYGLFIGKHGRIIRGGHKGI